MTSFRDRLRAPGVWAFVDSLSSPQVAEQAVRIEELGYSALWVPETLGRDPFANLAYVATATSSLILATGIANIHHRIPGVMRQAADTVAEQSDGRFVLGVGVSHAPMVEGLRGLDYSNPLGKMRTYLTAMTTSRYTGPAPAVPAPVLVAALGPKMLALAAEHADGAHPYWTTPDHTAMAREILGPDKLLCVEQKVVLCTDTTAAREAAVTALGAYATLPNYRNNFKRMGFTEDEIEHRDNRFIDAVVAWGSADDIRARVTAHYDAGADHVCIQPVAVGGGYTVDWAALEELAP